MEQPDQDLTKLGLPELAAHHEETPSKPGNSIFDTKNVSIYYGSFKAVTDVSLSIYENEITAFIGPSGCGKTTVLRTLNRMNDLIPTARVEGDVTYRGEALYAPAVSPTAVRRHIGMVFQKPNPFPNRSTTTWRTDPGSMVSARRPSWTRSSSGRCARPCSGRK